jgi:probable rRNA maturation factor
MQLGPWVAFRTMTKPKTTSSKTHASQARVMRAEPRSVLSVVGAETFGAHRVACAKAARRAFALVRVPARCNVTLGFVHDLEMRTLNRRFRGYDKSTDVLSFPAGASSDFDDQQGILGDIIISVDTALRQAHACGHPIDVEVAVLTMHGMLHLLGLDHERSSAEAALQLQIEVSYLDGMGISAHAALMGRSLLV